MSIKGDSSKATRLRRGSRQAVTLAMGAVVALSTTGCTKVGEIMALFKFKQANNAYVSQNYERAVQLYEETLANNPEMATVYFYLGNSYDNLYKPSEIGQPENDALIQKAVENYQLAVEKLGTEDETERQIKGLSLQYLMAAYGPDRLDDPARAEQVMISLIDLDPTEPTNYVQLGKLYEDAGLYDAAERAYVAARDARPNDTSTFVQLAGYYTRMGDFQKAIAAFEARAQAEPTNPEAFYTVATQYWDQAFRGPGVRDEEKRDYVEKGIVAIDKAIEIRPDYVEAIVYKNLLLRLQANLETNPARQQALIKQADQLRDQAEEIRKKKATGVGD